MKKKIAITLILIYNTTVFYAQWVNSFSLNTTTATIGYDACFTSEHNGMYYNNEYHPTSPSSTYGRVDLYNTTNGGINWNFNKSSVSNGIILYQLVSVLKQKTIYSLNTWEGLISISKTSNNGISWQGLPVKAGWLRNFSIIDTSHFFYTYTYLNYKIYLATYSMGNVIVKIDSFPNFTPYGIFFTDTLTGYTITRTTQNTKNHIIYKTVTGGNNWQTSFIDGAINLSTLNFPSANIGYGVGTSGIIIKTTDAGTTWKYLISNTTKNLRNLYFINDSIGYACGDSGLIIKTIDAGLNWQQQSTGVISSFSKIFFVNDSVGFALTGTKVYKINSTIFASLAELNLLNNYSVYPNPSPDGLYNLKINEGIKQKRNIVITVTNTLGQAFNNMVYTIEDNQTLQVNLANFASGLYTITAMIDGKSYSAKLEKE